MNVLPFLGGLVYQPATGYMFDLFDSSHGPHSVIAYRWFFVLLAVSLAVATYCAWHVRA